MTLKSKKLISGLALLVLLVGGGFYILNYQLCPTQSEERIVRGDSLSPLVEGGQTIKATFGYYNCNDVQRDDLVLYSYAGNEAPLIKIVRGVPGDSFDLEEISSGEWHILINREVLENSKGEPYLVSGKRHEMLSIYERSFHGKIPAETYLLLGDKPSGSTDSTRFGLVGNNDILGKAEPVPLE